MVVKTKCYTVSELEVAAVLEERGKPTMSLMVDKQRNAILGAPSSPTDASRNVYWLEGGSSAERHGAEAECEMAKAGVMATINHLRGEEDLRHASVQDVAEKR